jgi:2-methylcitrate dehydratase PrpD
MAAPVTEPRSLSRRMVRVARQLAYDDLPLAVVDKVKIGLLDMLSCAFVARELPWGRQAIQLASRSAGQATVIGTHVRSSACDAAFANATLGHGLVREDMHAGAVSHLGVVVYPVLLALSQQRVPLPDGRGSLSGASKNRDREGAESNARKISGRDFILATVTGYEIGASVGRALMDAEMVRRFRPTGITGPLAGAIAGSRLMSLNEDETVSAVGLAANTTAGLNEWPYSGGDEMFFHPGYAARSAVTAVQLAASGAHASETALDGPSGLLAGLGKAQKAAVIKPFSGPALEILSVYYKPAPACNYAQTACQAALALAGELRSTDIHAITVKASEAAVHYPGCDFSGPFERILQAKMSIQYCVAATLARGTIEESNYHLLSDREVMRLAGLAQLVADREFTERYPQMQGSEVEITLRSGEVLRKSLPDVIPATPAQIRERFRAACGAKAGAIEEIVNGLEDQDDLGTLCGLLN